MATTATISATLAYADALGASAELAVTELTATLTNTGFIALEQSVTTTEVAVNLGGIAAPGWAFFKNLDATNYIELRVGTGGAKFAYLRPGKVALVELGSGAQVPYAIANTATCKMQTLIFNT